jgi:hypothetical protein
MPSSDVSLCVVPVVTFCVFEVIPFPCIICFSEDFLKLITFITLKVKTENLLKFA